MTAALEVSMRRRDFIVLVVGSATMRPLMVHAQHAQKISRIGVLLPGTPESFSLRTRAFLDGLRELGYVEGRTIEIDWKWGQDRVETLSGLAAELVRGNADAIVTGGTFAAQALKAATSTIPIVMAIIGDPVAAGLVGNRCTSVPDEYSTAWSSEPQLDGRWPLDAPVVSGYRAAPFRCRNGTM
jgi:putative ABC transport system substrate-binding protein